MNDFSQTVDDFTNLRYRDERVGRAVDRQD